MVEEIKHKQCGFCGAVIRNHFWHGVKGNNDIYCCGNPVCLTHFNNVAPNTRGYVVDETGNIIHNFGETECKT